MLRTRLCEVLGIEVPLIGAPYGPFDQVELAAAVCESGGLGSLGTAVRPVADLRRQWARMRELTDRPFAINMRVTSVPGQHPWAVPAKSRLPAQRRITRTAVRRVTTYGIFLMPRFPTARAVDN